MSSHGLNGKNVGGGSDQVWAGFACREFEEFPTAVAGLVSAMVTFGADLDARVPDLGGQDLHTIYGEMTGGQASGEPGRAMPQTCEPAKELPQLGEPSMETRAGAASATSGCVPLHRGLHALLQDRTYYQASWGDLERDYRYYQHCGDLTAREIRRDGAVSWKGSTGSRSGNRKGSKWSRSRRSEYIRVRQGLRRELLARHGHVWQ